MVPLIIAGAVRLVAPVIAKKLLRDGVAKAGSAAKVLNKTPVTNMNQLPKTLYGKAKPTNTGRPTPKRTKADADALMARTKKNRQQIKDAAPSKPVNKSAPKKRELNYDERIARSAGRKASDAKIEGAVQARGSTKVTPAGQKGMALPRKGETVKRKSGGRIAQQRGWGKARRPNK